MALFSARAVTSPGHSQWGNVTCQVTRPNDTNAYTAGDSLADSTSAPTVLTLADVAEKDGWAGVIRGLTVAKSTATTTSCSFNVLLFRNTFTAANDNAAFSPSDAQARTMIAGVNFLAADAQALALNAVWSRTNLDIPFVCESTSNDLYVAVVWTAAYTPAASEIFDFTFLVEWR